MPALFLTCFAGFCIAKKIPRVNNCTHKRARLLRQSSLIQFSFRFVYDEVGIPSKVNRLSSHLQTICRFGFDRSEKPKKFKDLQCQTKVNIYFQHLKVSTERGMLQNLTSLVI